jgi:hypothetical protein
MISVGCWAGRIVLVCTLCDWQDPAPESLKAQDCRPLDELVEHAAAHVAAEHAPRCDTAGCVRAMHDGPHMPGPVAATIVSCAVCGAALDDDNCDAADEHACEQVPIFSADPPAGTPSPCFSLPPTDPDRFSRDDHRP